MSNQPHTRIHAERRELPPRRLQAKQIAHGCAPCWVMMQQSPHSGLWHRAQGPAASAPQAQRATPPPSPEVINWPVIVAASASWVQRASNVLRGRGCVAAALSAAVTLGCSAGGLSYRGVRGPATLQAVHVREHVSPPQGARKLGVVQASCRRVAPEKGYDDTPWSDIDCSAALMRRAIVRKAAEQGATALTAGQCDGLKITDAGVDCRATAWAVDSGSGEASADALSSAPLSDEQLQRVERAWQVLVSSYWAPQTPESEAATAAGPVPAYLVRELARHGLQDHRLGDLEAHCQAGICDEDDLRAGLRAAAGKVGADSLVAVRCIEDSQGPRCVASVARSPQEQ